VQRDEVVGPSNSASQGWSQQETPSSWSALRVRERTHKAGTGARFSKVPVNPKITEASGASETPEHPEKSTVGSVWLQAPIRLQMLYKQYHQHKPCHLIKLRKCLQPVLKPDSCIIETLRSRRQHYNDNKWVLLSSRRAKSFVSKCHLHTQSQCR